MAYEQKDNSGSLFKNDRKEKETHPDAKGSIMVDGVAYWISAWTKQDRNGNRYQSLSVQRKGQPAASKPAASKPVADDMEDSIPF